MEAFFLSPSCLYGIPANLKNSHGSCPSETGSGGFFPLQPLNQFAISQHLQNPTHYPFFTYTSTKLPGVPYSQVWVLNPWGPSCKFRDPSIYQVVSPFQRSEFQLFGPSSKFLCFNNFNLFLLLFQPQGWWLFLQLGLPYLLSFFFTSSVV